MAAEPLLKVVHCICLVCSDSAGFRLNCAWSVVFRAWTLKLLSILGIDSTGVDSLREITSVVELILGDSDTSTHFQHACIMAAVGKGWKVDSYFKSRFYGTLPIDSILGSYSQLQKSIFPQKDVQKYRLRSENAPFQQLFKNIMEKPTFQWGDSEPPFFRHWSKNGLSRVFIPPDWRKHPCIAPILWPPW
jgi:hypothetical protein